MPGTRTDPPLADAEAWRAWSSRWRAAGESMTARIVPGATRWPSLTAKAATRPSAGEVSVADAWADTDAGASTTSLTVAERTARMLMPLFESPLQPASSETAPATAQPRSSSRLTMPS